MARPTKKGLLYFPLDVDFFEDIKIRRLKKDCGNQAISLLIAIFCSIYRDEGYYLEINNDVVFLIAEQFGVSEDTVEEVVRKAVHVGIFDSDLYNKYQILTSHGIQERYFTAALQCKKTEVLVHRDFVYKNINPRSNWVITGENPVSSRRNQQSKIKKSKVKESKDILSGKPDHAAYEEIISYLNKRVGTNYKPTSKKTQSLIKARCNEGYTLEDFKKVIDNKTAEWKDDPKMSKFLRPETLFGTKFEGYLNQNITTKKRWEYEDDFEETMKEWQC